MRERGWQTLYDTRIINPSPNANLNPINQWLGPISPWLGPISQWWSPISQWLGPINQWLGPTSQCLGPINQWLGPINNGWVQSTNGWVQSTNGCDYSPLRFSRVNAGRKYSGRLYTNMNNNRCLHSRTEWNVVRKLCWTDRDFNRHPIDDFKKLKTGIKNYPGPPLTDRPTRKTEGNKVRSTPPTLVPPEHKNKTKPITKTEPMTKTEQKHEQNKKNTN